MSHIEDEAPPVTKTLPGETDDQAAARRAREYAAWKAKKAAKRPPGPAASIAGAGEGAGGSPGSSPERARPVGGAGGLASPSTSPPPATAAASPLIARAASSPPAPTAAPTTASPKPTINPAAPPSVAPPPSPRSPPKLPSRSSDPNIKGLPLHMRPGPPPDDSDIPPPPPPSVSSAAHTDNAGHNNNHGHIGGHSGHSGHSGAGSPSRPQAFTFAQTALPPPAHPGHASASGEDEGGDVAGALPPPHKGGASAGNVGGFGASRDSIPRPPMISSASAMAGHPNKPLSAKTTTPRDSLPTIPFDPAYAANKQKERERQKEEKEKLDRELMFTHRRTSSNRSGNSSTNHTPSSSMSGLPHTPSSGGVGGVGVIGGLALSLPGNGTGGTGGGVAGGASSMSSIPPPPSPGIPGPPPSPGIPPPPSPVSSTVSSLMISGVAPPTVIDESNYDYDWEPDALPLIHDREALQKAAHEVFVASVADVPLHPQLSPHHQHHRKNSFDGATSSVSPRKQRRGAGGGFGKGDNSMHTTPDDSPGNTPGVSTNPTPNRSREPSADDNDKGHLGVPNSAVSRSTNVSPNASPRGSVDEQHADSLVDKHDKDKDAHGKHDKHDKHDKDKKGGSIGKHRNAGSMGGKRNTAPAHRSVTFTPMTSLQVPHQRASVHERHHAGGRPGDVGSPDAAALSRVLLRRKFIRRDDNDWHDTDGSDRPTDHKEKDEHDGSDDSGSDDDRENYHSVERSAFRRIFGYANKKRARGGGMDAKFSHKVKGWSQRQSVGMAWLYRWVHSYREKAPAALKVNHTEEATLWLVARQNMPVDELYDHRLSLEDRLHIERTRQREREQLLAQQQRNSSEGDKESAAAAAAMALLGGGGHGHANHAGAAGSKSPDFMSSPVSTAGTLAVSTDPPSPNQLLLMGGATSSTASTGDAQPGGQQQLYSVFSLPNSPTAATSAADATIAYNSAVAAALRREKGLVLGHGLTLFDVLASDKYKDMFRRYCKSAYCEESLDFLERVEEYDTHHYASERAKHLLDEQKWTDQKALNFADKVCDEFVSARALRQINIDGNLRNALISRVNSIKTAVGDEYIQRMAGKLSGPPIHRTPVELFKNAKKSVSDMLDRDVFSRFVLSEEYNHMVQTGWAAIGGVESYKGTGWVNQENFCFLEVFVLEARGLDAMAAPVGKSDKPDKEATVYCVLNVDTKAHKTKPVGLHSKFDEHVEFPILTTTQHVVAVVWLHAHGTDTCLGRIIIPFATIKQPFGAVWYKLLPNKPTDEKEKSPPPGELRIKLCLNKESSHDPTCLHLGGDPKLRMNWKAGRFQDDGFDLDLTYVFDRLIAMAYPDPRNLKEYQEFFQKRHGGCHKMYNLCADRFYEPGKFHRVVRYPFEPGEPLSFDGLIELCENVSEWLNEHPQNVAVIHCNDGKEQTAFVVAAYLVYSGQQPNFGEALEFFSSMRLYNDTALVNKPSELRYLSYVERRAADRLRGIPLHFSAPLVTLRALVLYDTPKVLKDAVNSSQLWFNVNCRAFYATSENQLRIQHKRKHGVDLTECNITGPGLALSSDVHLEVFFRKRGRHRLCHFWFSTRFLDPPKRTATGELISRLSLTKPEIDKAHADDRMKHFSPQFRLECYFSHGLAPALLAEGAVASIGALSNATSPRGGNLAVPPSASHSRQRSSGGPPTLDTTAAAAPAPPVIQPPTPAAFPLSSNGDRDSPTN